MAPFGAVFAAGHDHHHGTLQFANGTLDDRGRRQWPLHALYWGRLRRPHCHRFYRASLPYGYGLLRLQPRAASFTLVDGADTFERVLQSAIEDLTYARAIMRIRSLYLELAPQLRPYFVLAADDERRRPRLKVGLHPSWWQVFLTTAGMIAALNSVLVGVFVGLLLSALFTFPLQVCTSVGVVSFLVSLSLHQRYQWGQWRRLEQDLAALAQAQRT